MDAPTPCSVTYTNGTKSRTKKFFCLEIAHAFINQVVLPNGYDYKLKENKKG